MPHNPALDALNEALWQALTTSPLTVGTAIQILTPPPALPAPSVSLKPDQCGLSWDSPADNCDYAALTIRQDGTVECALHQDPKAGYLHDRPHIHCPRRLGLYRAGLYRADSPSRHHQRRNRQPVGRAPACYSSAAP